MCLESLYFFFTGPGHHRLSFTLRQLSPTLPSVFFFPNLSHVPLDGKANLSNTHQTVLLPRGKPFNNFSTSLKWSSVSFDGIQSSPWPGPSPSLPPIPWAPSPSSLGCRPPSSLSASQASRRGFHAWGPLLNAVSLLSSGHHLSLLFSSLRLFTLHHPGIILFICLFMYLLSVFGR